MKAALGGTFMADNKHLTLDQRISIQEMVSRACSFKAIADSLGKDPSTISKEIRLHIIRKRTGTRFLKYNSCKKRRACEKTHICISCRSDRKVRFCRNCSMCNSFCSDYEEQGCEKLSRPPYVCNGCPIMVTCTLEKRLYDAKAADKAYRERLSESRTGISLSQEEVKHLDQLITPLIRQKQSPHHICVTNKDTIMVSERTIYRLIDSRIISAMNIDLQRKVRFSARKQKVHTKVDKKCREGRTYEDFLEYRKEHPDSPVVELDSVEGKKGSKVLLTIHFKKAEMMLAFLREHNDSKSVIDAFEKLYKSLGKELFAKIFPVCLADNGSEFSNPSAIEYDHEKQPRTRMFFCDPSAPYQKGSAERNHEFIRLCIPKGTDLANYTEDDISMMMDNINSYARPGLADKCPYDMFSYLYGENVLELLGCHKIASKDVELSPAIFKRKKSNEA